MKASNNSHTLLRAVINPKPLFNPPIFNIINDKNQACNQSHNQLKKKTIGDNIKAVKLWRSPLGDNNYSIGPLGKKIQTTSQLTQK